MITIAVRAQLTSDELLQAVEQLDTPELEAFTQNVLALRAQRHAAPSAMKEAELLQRINQKVSASFRQRYKKLIARRQAEMLTPQELTELLKMTDEMEAHNVARLEALVQLAGLRGISLDAVMQQLGIQAVSHG
jgi:hypothetical protein